MRRYDVLKYLRKFILIFGIIALLIIGLTAALTLMRETGSKQADAGDHPASGGMIKGETILHEEARDADARRSLDMSKAADPKHLDISGYLKRDSQKEKLKRGAEGFILEFRDSVLRRDRDFLLSRLNREAIERSFYHVNEDGLVEGIYKQYELLNNGAELFLTGLYPVKGGDGYFAAAVEVMRKTEGDELEYDYENQQNMSFTLYFDNNDVVSYLPFAEYSMRQYADGYGLSQ